MTDADIERRLRSNLDAVMGEIAAPPRGRLERLLIALRVPEPTARLVAATPALRWSWLAAVGVMLLFASSAAGAQAQPGDRLAVFLTLAPIVPVIGVALAYGPRADRAHEVSIAAPLSGLRLVLLRSVTVVVAAAVVSSAAVLAAPERGWTSVGWLLPALATTSAALAIGTRIGVRRAAGAVSMAWIVLVIVVAQVADDAVAPFGPLGQLVAASVAVGAAIALLASRHRLERWSEA